MDGWMDGRVDGDREISRQTDWLIDRETDG
jgi:hypothetical protein